MTRERRSLPFGVLARAMALLLVIAAATPGGVASAAQRTGFLYDDRYLEHKTGDLHPEKPARLVAIAKRLEEKGILPQLTRLRAAPAPLGWITTIHAPDYAARLKKSCADGVAFLDTGDCPISERTHEVAVAAVGGVLATIDAVAEGKIRNAFCAVRPPGHHALKGRAMGFCFFNNVAIAARYIQKKHKLAKVLIVDWDVHHGNGTQDAFYDDPTVLYFGVHQYPFYPGTGSDAEKGAGKGLGSTVNVPLRAGSGDREFRRAFEEKLRPAALAFRPDFVLISAGFDAHADDPLGSMEVTAAGFAELTRIVKAIADRCCQGRLVSVLEGGYNLEGLAESVEAHIRVLMR
jgi:acetoin utilization deacetylase AcuC-like enzyme